MLLLQSSYVAFTKFICCFYKVTKKNALPKRAVHPFYHISVKLSASLTEISSYQVFINDHR